MLNVTQSVNILVSLTRIKILEIHQKEIFPGEISVTLESLRVTYHGHQQNHGHSPAQPKLVLTTTHSMQ